MNEPSGIHGVDHSLPPSLAGVVGRRAQQRRLLLGFCALSFGLHVGLAAGWIFAPDARPPAIDLDKAVKTRLVKLGKQRDEKMLPRLPTSRPPPPAAKKAPPTPHKEPAPKKPEPKAKKPPSAAEILEKFNEKNDKRDLSELINKRLGEETDEGREDGDRDGTELTGEMKATYFQRVAGHIQRNLEISATISDEERMRLTAVLALKVAADGSIIDARIQSSSGSTRFDNDVLGAAKRSSPVPAPPPLVRDFAKSGFAFNICPRQSCS